MHLDETIICATAPETSSAGAGSVAIHDIHTGSALASFKQSNAPVYGTTFVESGNGQGGFVLCAQYDKAILNVYNFQKVCLTYLPIDTGGGNFVDSDG